MYVLKKSPSESNHPIHPINTFKSRIQNLNSIDVFKNCFIFIIFLVNTVYSEVHIFYEFHRNIFYKYQVIKFKDI